MVAYAEPFDEQWGARNDARMQAIADAISTFEAGDIDVVERQSRLDAVAASLDSSHREVLDELKRADAGLERVVFGAHQAQQREGALEVVAGLRAVVDPDARDTSDPRSGESA